VCMERGLSRLLGLGQSSAGPSRLVVSEEEWTGCWYMRLRVVLCCIVLCVLVLCCRWVNVGVGACARSEL
jgi:hypothetical protein